MSKLKSVKAKMRLRDYMTQSGLNSFNTTALKVLAAYSDCLPENVDMSSEDRNLDYFSHDGLDLKTAKLVMKAACPDGYNSFNAEKSFEKIEAAFGENCLVFLGRESSVVIYVKPEGSRHVWFDRKINLLSISDEFSYIPALSMFRLWWD